MPVRHGRTLPRLDQPRTRIALLAGSYLAAATASQDGNIGGPPDSRLLARNPELWTRGSYDDFERAIETLPDTISRSWIQCFWRVFVTRGAQLVRDEHNGRAIIGYWGDPVHVKRPRLDTSGRQIIDGAGRKKWHESTERPFREFALNEVAKAETVLAELELGLRGSDLTVPAPITLAAGYLPSEAKAWDRLGKDAA